MNRFFLAIAGSFVGKILAGLVISVCIAIGFGPDRWASWILDLSPSLVSSVRWLFRITAIVALLSVVGWLYTKANAWKPASWPLGKIRRHFIRVRKRLRYWTTRIHRWWQFVRPGDNEVLRQTHAVGRPYFESFENDRIAFAHRFSNAFPGARWLLTFQGSSTIIPRLDVLLGWPLSATSSAQDRQRIPFYWNCGAGNMHITRYRHYKRNAILLNEMEIRPTYLAAIGGNVYWQSYVYLEGAAFEPRIIPGEENRKIGEYQEFAVYEGKIFNRAEYDDGSYVKNGRPVRFLHAPDLRSRHLVPFGMLIVPNSSPANKASRDKAIRAYISNIITDKATMKEFAKYLMSLPKE